MNFNDRMASLGFNGKSFLSDGNIVDAEHPAPGVTEKSDILHGLTLPGGHRREPGLAHEVSA